VIRYLIDANSAVYAMDDGHETLTARIADSAPGEIAISVISYAEVAYGTYVGKPPPPEILEAFVAAIPLVPFDEAAAREYARLPFKRARLTDCLPRMRSVSAPSLSPTTKPILQTCQDWRSRTGQADAWSCFYHALARHGAYCNCRLAAVVPYTQTRDD